ncbi:MAG: prolipoprotein diacylglyceryl transferase [Myxococcales bacterium]|nr:prolipoprotein diacylglyceryl transferase [Myxococcales bacterium]
MLLVGFCFATAIAVVHARRMGLNPDVIVDLALASLLLGVIGGRLMHVVADGHFWDYVHACTDPSQVDWKISEARCATEQGQWDAAAGVCHPATADCFAWAKFWQGGLAYYGGLIAAALGAVWLLRRDRFPFWKAADITSVAIAVGLAFGRMGCLLAGCCFGRASDGPLALSFPAGSPASEAQHLAGHLERSELPSLGVHPTQIYESAMCLGIAAVCMLIVAPRKRYDGQVFVAFLSLYAVGRFLIEYLRDDERGALLGLSSSQLLGVGLVAVAAFIHQRRSRRPATA